MPHVLHLLKDPTSRTALDVIARQGANPAVRLSVVLLQDASGLTAPLPGRVYRLEDGRSGGLPHPRITHDQLLDLIFSADSVIAW